MPTTIRPRRPRGSSPPGPSPRRDPKRRNGGDAHPLWTWLRSEKGGLLGSAVKWNFAKFLVAPDGTVISRHAPTTSPESLTAEIGAYLPR